MGHVLFYLAVVAGCLLWSAACIAAATRSRRSQVRSVRAAAAMHAADQSRQPATTAR